MAIDVGDGILRITGDTSGVDASLDRMRKKAGKAGTESAKKLGKVSQALQRIKTLAIAAAAAFGVFAAIKFFKDTVRAAGEFEAGMNRVRALTGAVGKDFDALKKQAKELGRTTQFSARQAAEGMGFLAQAGFTATEIIGAMPATLKLAAAAQLDLASSADIVSNIMAGFGQTVDELPASVDVLTKAFTSANTDLQQLGQAMKFVGPVAKSAGVSFEETAAALSLMGNAGIQASMAGTGLRMIITKLQKPTGEAAKIMKRLGISVFDSEGKMRSLIDILKQFEKAPRKPGDEITIFGNRAGPAFQVLLGQGAEALREFTAELENSGGTADRISKIQMEGFRGSLIRLKSAWEGLQIAIAEAGLLEFLTKVNILLARFSQRTAEAVEAGKGFSATLFLFKGFAFFLKSFLQLVLLASSGIRDLTGNVLDFGVVVLKTIRKILEGIERITPGETLRPGIDALTRSIAELERQASDFRVSAKELRNEIRDMETAWQEVMNPIKKAGEAIEDAGEKSKGAAGASDAAGDAAGRMGQRYDEARESVEKILQAVIRLTPALERLVRIELTARRQSERNIKRLAEQREEQEGLALAVDKTTLSLEEAAPPLVDYEEQLRAAGEEALKLGFKNEELQGTFEDLSHVIGTAFEDAIIGGEGLRGVLKGLLDDINRIILRAAITKPLAGAILGGLGKALPFIPFLQHGGFLPSKQMALVGEKGPELFASSRSGRIIPNDKLAGLGGTTINNYIDARAAVPGAELAIARALRAVESRAVMRAVAVIREGRLRGG